MAFLVILLSPRGPHRPCVVPVIPTLSPSSSCCPHVVSTSSPSSLSSSCCPHSPQKVPMWSPWSVVSTCCPRHPRFPTSSPLSQCHVIPTSSPHCPHHPRCPRHPHVVPIAPRRSPCGLHGLWSPHVCPCCPRRPHIIPVISTLSRRSPHHPQPPKYPVHPSPPPGGVGPRISKNAIRFELIKIF